MRSCPVALVTSSVSTNSIATVTLCDESNLNAMSEQMAADFSAVVASLRGVKGVRAIILTGAGKAFSAGGHLEMLQKKRLLSAEANRIAMHSFYNSFLGILDLKVPLIAAINGAAIGAGLCVACACDIRIASADSKLGFTFLKLGLHPGMGATFLVPRIVGQSLASELLLTARIVDASEGLRLGLVSKVVARESLQGEAEKIASEILACGPESTAQLLETMRADMAKLPAALAREALCQSLNYGGLEFAEGISAITEKRSPLFAQ